MTVGRSDGRTAGVIVVAAALLAVWPSGRLAAQDSQFGIRGLGTPGKWESVRARSAGGGFAPFDPFSPLMDAALADIRRTSASVTSGTSWRAVDASGTQSSLRGTRFPAITIGGPLVGKIVIAGGFTTYLDRTFGIVTHDTIDLRGTPQPITDDVTSDGAVTDLRFAAAMRPRRWVALGAGIHLLTGSSRIVATRTFADSANYRTSSSRDEVAYGGKGVSLSALFEVTQDLRVATWWRTDSRLRADLSGRTVADNDLPVSYGGGILWRAGGQAVFAGSVAWHGWSTAATGDSTGGPSAHDTFNWSAGAELGPATSPIRFGARGGQLPFGVGKAPTEVGYSAGIGRSFSQGRGRLDIGLERLQRKGTGLTERVWTLLLGLTVRP
ncbi:MAG TPA: hypothetical protein VL549_04615 [Gemmatimonadales bacterium]|nr:hypothetical protein [Gemmatimonadales bacterium]